jgi:hypothetical protein
VRPAGNRATSAALATVVAIAAGGAGAAIGEKPKPKPPKPRVELLTGNQEGALRHRAIRAEVRSRRGSQARVKGTLYVDGYPDDYVFRLGPKSKRLRGGEARVALELSARQREVLDFAAQTCRPASITVSAKVGKRSRTVDERLRKPRDC